MKAHVKSGKMNLPPEIKEAMNAEAERMAKLAMEEMNRNNEEEFDALVLYTLHEEFGFGEKRLKRFYKNFSLRLHELGERYQMNEYEDKLWLCRKKLKELGIDISELRKGEEIGL